MNPYFVLFALCALLASQVSVRVDARLGQGSRVAVRVEVSGVPLVVKRRRLARSDKPPPSEVEKARKRARGLQAAETLLALMRRGWLRPMLRLVRLQSLYLHVRLSQPDAAATALGFAGARVALEALARCGALPKAVRGRVEADFTGSGSRVYASMLLGARIGALCVSGVMAAAAVLCLRAEQHQQEEEQHAATSH